MARLAIFGGTFNPIHNGHIDIAVYFKEYLNLDKVIFIPTNISPHKEIYGNISTEDRYKMCLLATQKYEFMEVSDIEILRDGPSYTVDTLEILIKKYSNTKFYIIMGADMFLTVQDWKKSSEILKNAIICTVPRDDSNYQVLKKHENFLKKYGADTIVADRPVTDISSTMVRNKILNNENIDLLIPKSVKDYIIKRKLYFR